MADFVERQVHGTIVSPGDDILQKFGTIVLSDPAAGKAQVCPRFGLRIYNADSISHTISFRLIDSSNLSTETDPPDVLTIHKVTLGAGETYVHPSPIIGMDLQRLALKLAANVVTDNPTYSIVFADVVQDEVT